MSEKIKERLKKGALAERMGLSRPTLNKYLGMVGAPPPDGKGSYEVEAVLAWFSQHSEVAGNAPRTMQDWKIREVQLRCQKMEDQLQRDRGEYISKQAASKTIIPLMAELGELMRQKFILELPSRYRGHDQVECAEFNEHAIDAIVKRFREGSKELVVEEA